MATDLVDELVALNEGIVLDFPLLQFNTCLLGAHKMTHLTKVCRIVLTYFEGIQYSFNTSLYVFTEEARLKVQYNIIGEQLKQVKLRKQQIMLDMKTRVLKPKTVDNEVAELRRELEDLKKVMRQQRTQRVKPTNLVVVNDDSDVETDD